MPLMIAALINMIYGVSILAVFLLPILLVAYRQSSSRDDAIGLMLGVAVGLLGGAIYGVYLNQPHLVMSSGPWPLIVSMIVGGVVGLVAAIYTRKWWKGPLATLLRRFRFSIKSLLILTTLFCLSLGMHMSSYWQQKHAVNLLSSQGFRVEYRFPRRNGRLTHLARLSRTIGPDHFLTPYSVDGHEDELTDEGLVGLKQFFHIERLNFQNTGVTTNVLSLLGSREHLVHFSMGRERAVPSDNGSGLTLLSECKDLYWLNLENVAIPDKGFSFLKSCPRLHTLQLYDMQMDDNDVAVILELSSVRVLGLGGTNITDKSVPHLSKATGLRQLFLNGTNITDAGAAQLQDALPDCRIFR